MRRELFRFRILIQSWSKKNSFFRKYPASDISEKIKYDLFKLNVKILAYKCISKIVKDSSMHSNIIRQDDYVKITFVKCRKCTNK